MILHFTSLDSTNIKAVQLAQKGAEPGTVVHADYQTGGKGRGGRRFISPPGGLYFSLIFTPQLQPDELPLITLAAGVGVSVGILSMTGVRVQLKWPNDLYVEGKKLGGILTETGMISSGCTPQFVVIGIGLNVQTDMACYPSSLQGKVVSLYHVNENNAPAADTLLRPLVESVKTAVKSLETDRAQMLALWQERDYLQGRAVEYNGQDGLVAATGVGLAEDGRYIICDKNNREYAIVAGDINPIRLSF